MLSEKVRQRAGAAPRRPDDHEVHQRRHVAIQLDLQRRRVPQPVDVAQNGLGIGSARHRASGRRRSCGRRPASVAGRPRAGAALRSLPAPAPPRRPLPPGSSGGAGKSRGCRCSPALSSRSPTPSPAKRADITPLARAAGRWRRRTAPASRERLAEEGNQSTLGVQCRPRRAASTARRPRQVGCSRRAESWAARSVLARARHQVEAGMVSRSNPAPLQVAPIRAGRGEHEKQQTEAADTRNHHLVSGHLHDAHDSLAPRYTSSASKDAFILSAYRLRVSERNYSALRCLATRALRARDDDPLAGIFSLRKRHAPLDNHP